MSAPGTAAAVSRRRPRKLLRESGLRAALKVISRLVPGLLGVWLAAAPALAARVAVDYRGTVIPARRVEPWFESAPGAGDSAAVANGLRRLRVALESLGHLDARVRAARDTSVTPARWRIEVSEGPRTRLADVRLETARREDSLALARVLELAPGGWVSPPAIGAALDRALATVVEDGHAYAELAVSSLDWDSAGARLRLSGTLGPRVIVDRVRIEGLAATQPRFARRIAAVPESLPYRPSLALAGRDRLLRTGLFRSVEFAGLQSRGDWSRGEVVYRVEERRYSQFEAALGVQGEGRVVGLADVRLDHLGGTGRALQLGWRSDGPGLQRFAARIAEPMLFGQPLTAVAALTHDRQDTLFTRTDAAFRLEVALESRRRLELEVQDQRVVSAVGAIGSADAALTGAALESDGRDDPFAPRRGVRARVEGSQSFLTERPRAGGRRKTQIGGARAELEWHRPWRAGSRAGIALELSGAGRFSSRDVIELHDQLPLGGAASLRGFDEQQFRVDRYGLSRLEWRWFLGRGGERVALFWDHAWTGARVPAGEGATRFVDRHHDGVGFGLRLPTAGGLAGLDVGLEPGRPLLEARLHLQLTTTF